MGISISYTEPVTYRGGGLGGSNPLEIPKALQNCPQNEPDLKSVKNC